MDLSRRQRAFPDPRLLLIPALLLLFPAVARSQVDAPLAAETLVEPPPIEFRILDQGGPRMITTNWGYVGTQGGQLLDSSTGKAAIPFEYPAGSGITYLYDAGLWVGGIVDGDTMVSTGTFSFFARHELYPDTGAAGRLVFDDYFADEGYRAAYADTFTNPKIVPPDGIDGLHRPLNVLVRQETRAWSDPAYRDFVWVQVVVTNVGSRTINHAFIGWQVDPDIYHLDNPAGYADDLVGFRGGKIPYAGSEYFGEGVYVIDNDGDPDSTLGFTVQSPTAGLGLSFISAVPPAAERSFNWWVTSFSPPVNWGPHRPSPDPHLPDLAGRPLGDVARYRMMANGEIDYDQVYAGVDMSAQGWTPPPDTFFFAAGHDIFFLYAAGPFTIPPGDSAVVNYVWLAGADFHTDPAHFANTFSFSDPLPFLWGLNFGPWSNTIGAAIHLEQSGFTAAAPGPPRGLQVESWTTTSATVRWQPKRTFDIARYDLFRHTLPERVGQVNPVFLLTPDDSMFTDHGLVSGEYAYSILAFDEGGRHGLRSELAHIDLRYPMPVVLDNPVPTDGKITLTWVPSIYPDVSAYHIERFLPGSSGDTIPVSLGTVADTHFADPTAEKAVVYEYAVTAESSAGLLGQRSNRVRGMVMAFDGGPLIIDQTLADPSGLTDKDSVRAFWQRVLPEAVYRDEDRSHPLRIKLFDFNHHPVTIVVTSGRYSETEQVHRLLADYALAGGSVLFVGRDLFNLADLPYGARVFGPGDYPYDYLGVTRAVYAPTLVSHPTRMNAEFVGARSCHQDFADLIVDATRTDWGVPPPLPPVGPAIPFVGWIEGDPGRTECLYTFQSRYPDTSSAQDKTVGLILNDDLHRAAVLNFPLEMMNEAEATATLRSLLAKLGYAPLRPGDIDGDGSVNPVDVVRLAGYLFRNGSPPLNLRNADVNADCRVNLVDLVILVNHLYRGGATLSSGCATR